MLDSPYPIFYIPYPRRISRSLWILRPRKIVWEFYVPKNFQMFSKENSSSLPSASFASFASYFCLLLLYCFATVSLLSSQAANLQFLMFICKRDFNNYSPRISFFISSLLFLLQSLCYRLSIVGLLLLNCIYSVLQTRNPT